MSTTKKNLQKMILLGDSGVGKTSLINQFVNRKFNRNYKTTIGADFMSKDIMVDDQLTVLQIWDTAGQERFQSLSPYYFRGADSCILVFDLTIFNSFKNLERWVEEFKTRCCAQIVGFPILVIGNKSDLSDQRVVSTEEAKEWCKNHGNLPYFETSSLEAYQVDKSILTAARMALKRSQEEAINIKETSIILDDRERNFMRKR